MISAIPAEFAPIFELVNTEFPFGSEKRRWLGELVKGALRDRAIAKHPLLELQEDLCRSPLTEDEASIRLCMAVAVYDAFAFGDKIVEIDGDDLTSSFARNRWIVTLHTAKSLGECRTPTQTRDAFQKEILKASRDIDNDIELENRRAQDFATAESTEATLVDEKPRETVNEETYTARATVVASSDLTDTDHDDGRRESQQFGPMLQGTFFWGDRSVQLRNKLWLIIKCVWAKRPEYRDGQVVRTLRVDTVISDVWGHEGTTDGNVSRCVSELATEFADKNIPVQFSTKCGLLTVSHPPTDSPN